MWELHTLGGLCTLGFTSSIDHTKVSLARSSSLVDRYVYRKVLYKIIKAVASLTFLVKVCRLLYETGFYTRQVFLCTV